MFIDTHCHLTDNYVAGDLDAVLARAANANVGMMICPTADPNDIAGALRIAETHKNIFATIGIHPEYAGTDATQYMTPDVLNHPRVVGIGEIGLDYHDGTDTRRAQTELFQQQLDLAKACALPVAIHTRDAERDTADLLRGDVRGVMHC